MREANRTPPLLAVLLLLGACDGSPERATEPATDEPADPPAPVTQEPQAPRMHRTVICGRPSSATALSEGLTPVEIRVHFLGSESRFETSVRPAALGWICLLDAREARSPEALPDEARVEGLDEIGWLPPRHAPVPEEQSQSGASLVATITSPGLFWRLRHWDEAWRSAAPDARERLCAEIGELVLDPARESAYGFMEDWLARGDPQVDPHQPPPDRLLEDVARRCAFTSD